MAKKTPAKPKAPAKSKSSPKTQAKAATKTLKGKSAGKPKAEPVQVKAKAESTVAKVPKSAEKPAGLVSKIASIFSGKAKDQPVEKAVPVKAAAPVESQNDEPKVKATKAPKEKKVRASKSADGSGQATPENLKKWQELSDRFGGEKASTYSMSAQFEANHPIEHKVLGWGYVLSNNNDRLEVLFETGIKILISNYKG